MFHNDKLRIEVVDKNADVVSSGCDKYVRILVRLLYQRLKRLGYVRLFVGFVSYVVVAINFEVVFVLLFFHYGFHFFHP